MALLTRNDVVIRTRKMLCCVSRMASDLSRKYANGIMPCDEEIKKVELMIAYIEVLKCYEPPIAEVLARGTATLSGTNGTILMLVNNVPITENPVAFATDLATTAAAIETAADAFTSVPDYTVAVNGSVLTITATAGSGAVANGYAIAAITTGNLAVTTTAFTGGVTGRVDGDNCFTSVRAQNIFSQVEELSDIAFAPNGITYINPSLELMVTQDLLANTGDPILVEGVGGIQGAPITTEPLRG